MFAEGPDELLGGYQADIESKKLMIFFKRKYLQPFLKNEIIKKIVIKVLRLNKNIEFEFSYEPFLYKSKSLS